MSLAPIDRNTFSTQTLGLFLWNSLIANSVWVMEYPPRAIFRTSTDRLDNFSGRSLAAIESPAIRIVLCGDVVGLLQNLGEALTDGVDGCMGVQ